MLTELALALAIQKTNPKIPEATAQKYALWVLEESEKNDLDPWLFQALIHRETRWTAQAVRHESNGTCSVGLGQINGKCDEKVMAPLRDPRRNLHRMGELLVHMREVCTRKCQDLGWLRAYNPGSPAYLRAIQEAVKQYHAHYDQPAVLCVSPGMCLAWMSGEGGRRSICDCGLDSGNDDSRGFFPP